MLYQTEAWLVNTVLLMSLILIPAIGAFAVFDVFGNAESRGVSFRRAAGGIAEGVGRSA